MFSLLFLRLGIHHVSFHRYFTTALPKLTQQILTHNPAYLKIINRRKLYNTYTFASSQANDTNSTSFLTRKERSGVSTLGLRR